MGLLLGRKLLGYEVDHLAVNTEPEYQEIKRGDEIRRDHFTDATTASGRQPEPARSKRIVVD
jgi:hypothetical protein